MIIEGKNPVKEALNNNLTISKLYIQTNAHDTNNIVELAKANKVKFSFVEKTAIDKLSPTKRHQGVLAVVEDFKYCEVKDIISLAKDKNEKLFMLILDGVEDPHNLGSILRIAECAGVHGVVIPKHRAVSVNETVAKTSAGATAYVKVAMVTNINDTIRELADNFINVFCADMDGENVYDAHFCEDMAIVMGGEGNGVKALTKKLCNKTFAIPMFGKINSLNVSVATGIVVYTAVQQRQGKCK